MPDIDAAQLSGLIALIYDCAIDPERWTIAMEALRVELGMFNCSMDLVALPSQERLLNHMTGIAEPFASQMLSNANQTVTMWGGPETLASLPMDEPALLSRVVGPAAWASPVYLEWAEPQGICDLMAIFLARDAHGLGALGMGRHRDAPPIDDRVLGLARLLVPHLQRAATINRLLDLTALRHKTFAAIFDTMATPILVVGRHLSISHANAAAVEMLKRDTSLRSRNGVLTASDQVIQAALTAAVTQAADAASKIGRAGFGIPLADHDGLPRAIYVLPLRDGALGADAEAALFVANRTNAPAMLGSVVERLFGLTPTEQEVFSEIVSGRRVNDTARSLGIAPSTVRTHLLRIYDKTGMRRQAELVRLAADLKPPVL